MRRVLLLGVSVACALCAAAPALAGDVSVGSPPGTTPQNHQNEPAVAIDANHPNIVVSGWNDFVDWAPCPQADAQEFGTCADPADDGVGLSAFAFSFDSGHSWIQPAYTGWTANDCSSPRVTRRSQSDRSPTRAAASRGRTASVSITATSSAPGRPGSRFRIRSSTATWRSACRGSTIRRRPTSLKSRAGSHR